MDFRKVLVLATRKNFWGSKESEVFQSRLYTPKIYGYSESWINSIALLFLSFFKIVLIRPQAILIGQAGRVALLYAHLRRLGFLKKTILLTIDPIYLHDKHIIYFERVLVYCTDQIRCRKEIVKSRVQWIPLPASGDFEGLISKRGDYIFSFGAAYRDYPSFIRASGELGVPVIILVWRKEDLEWGCSELPKNVNVIYRKNLGECLELVSKSRFVVIPLKEGQSPHGHSAVVQALRLGKAVISTKRATVEDYLEEGVNGLLVDPGSAEGYLSAMRKLWKDDQFLTSLELNALKKSEQFSYAYFAGELRRVVKGLLVC